MGRDRRLAAFLADSGWGGAARRKLAGDASFRRYERLVRPGTGETCVLMDAPVRACGPLDPFISITAFLRGMQLSAPRILAEDRGSGFLLLEDLGDDLFASVLARRPELEADIYDAAIDVLAEIARMPVPGDIPVYSAELQSELAALSLEWYYPGALGEPAQPALASAMKGELERLIGGMRGPKTFAHRDFHAENLIWLPLRPGSGRIGLLDYQDGARADPAYDLVSLIEDARRDLGPGLRERLLRRYAGLSGSGEAELQRRVAICGAQRNLRIVGVFARLAIRDGKRGYVDLIPRVWGHLARDLAHPDLARLKGIVENHLPAPGPSVLRRLAESAA